MPYRQLPATDVGRLVALQAAQDKAVTVPAGQLAISAANKTLLDGLLPQFRTEVEQRGTALAQQATATEAQDAQGARTRTWTSHFLQTLNLAIERGVIPASARAYYLLDVSQTTLPRMTNEADLVLWSGRVVSGEVARVAAGGAAITFPSAAEVGTELSQYQTLRSIQSTKKDAYDEEQEDVEALRSAVDALVRDIWDEVEFFFRHESPSSLRSKAREYGVYYASRAGEPIDIEIPPAAPTGVTVTIGAGNALTVQWNPVTGADSYQILKQEVGTDPDFVVAGTSTTANFALGAFPTGATVRVKVRALHGTTASPDSVVVETSITQPGP